MKKVILVFCLSLSASFLMAQDVGFIPKPLKACPIPLDESKPLEKSAKEVQALVDRAPTDFKSMDDFLSQLPKSMTSNFIFMGESRSFQTASKENPRVILTSPNADVRISFNTEKGQRGYNNIEISIWDPMERKFNYQELTFDPGGAKPPKKHGDLACTTCHGDPPKPNWDTYNYWAGVIPFNKDTLVKGSVELEWYTNLMNKTKDQTEGNRLRFLTPLEDNEQIKEALDSDGYITRQILSDEGNKFDGNAGGIATQLFDRLQERQSCAEAKNLSNDKNFDKFKYLLRGIQEGCSNLEQFVPGWYSSVASDYFYGTVEGFKRNSTSGGNVAKQTKDGLRKDTTKRQKAIREDKDNRQRYFLERNLGNDKSAADKEMDLQIEKIGLNAIGISPGEFQENIGEDSNALTNLRYYLEPLGAAVGRFSTSIDPRTYSFADTFEYNYLLPEDIDRMKYDMAAEGFAFTCNGLARKSLEVLGTAEVAEKLVAKASKLCRDKAYRTAVINIGKDDVLGFSESLLDFKAGEIFRTKCMSCHKDQMNNGIDYSIGGAPLIPFGNPMELTKYFTSPTGKLLGRIDNTIERLNRPHNIPGAMPIVGIVDLSDEDKVYLEAWLKNLKDIGNE